MSGVVAVVVLTLTNRYNAVRGLRTGSNNSGTEDYLRRKTKKKQKVLIGSGVGVLFAMVLALVFLVKMLMVAMLEVEMVICERWWCCCWWCSIFQMTMCSALVKPYHPYTWKAAKAESNGFKHGRRCQSRWCD